MVLGVSTRDNQDRIMEAAEDCSLLFEPETCQHARASLTNPRRRLEAEFAWFPGVAPVTANKAAALTTFEQAEQLSLTGIAKANALLIAVSHALPSGIAPLREFVSAMALAADEVELSQALREINEDRQIAGFPAFTNVDAAEDLLRERRQVWRRGVISVLDSAPTGEMAEAVFTLVKEAAATGQFPRFLHDLIDDYSIRTQPFMAREFAGAERLVAKARELAGSRPDALPPIFKAIGDVLNTWEETTYPLQMSATLRGQTDADSERLGFMIRSLSVDLFNEHGLLNESRQISTMVGASFSALPHVAGKIAEDHEALNNLSSAALQREADLAYAANIGTFAKSRLAISGSSVEWKGQQYPLTQIQSARWGAVRRSVNGVPTGTDYLIFWSDGRRSANIEFRNEQIYSEFTARLWRALGEHMFGVIIDQLRAGRELQFGNAIISDENVILRRKKFFGDEPAQFAWGDVTVGSADGSFVIAGPSGSKATATMSYRDVDNVHFLDAIIRYAFKKGSDRLSEAYS
jgi:hypothetical protein